MATIIKGKNPRKPFTVRYQVNGRQRERSFDTAKGARDFKVKAEFEARAGTFIDPRLASVRFADYAQQQIEGMAASSGTIGAYLCIHRAWVAPWAGDRTLAQVSQDREGLTALINRQMVNDAGTVLSYNRRGTARTIVLAAVNEAVNAGRLQSHRLAGVKLAESTEEVSTSERRDFVFPAYAPMAAMAAELAPDFGPVLIWLMRGCGLRIREALAVNREDFRENGTVLRCCGQASLTGDRKVALKHRRAGQYRDIPVPAYLWTLVSEMPKGPVCRAGRQGGNAYLSYSVTYKAFTTARVNAEIPPGFTPHSLRHAFASTLLARGVPITDVAMWMGHQSIDETYRTYGHLVPSAAGRAADTLEGEFEEWSRPTLRAAA